jgi:hypothetical protein
MNTTFNLRLTQLRHYLQDDLFPLLDAFEVELTPALQKVTIVLEMVHVERFIPGYQGLGRPPKDRMALARAFVAKAVLGLPTTEALIDRLKMDMSLRRLCRFSRTHRIPGSHRFSRAFAEFAENRLAESCHKALIQKHLGDQLIGHVSRDSTAIEAREKPLAKSVEEKNAEKAAEDAAKASPPKRGRPRRGEVRPPKPETRIEKQQNMTVQQMIADLPKTCDIGCKRDSQGFTHSWRGYKLHIDTVDGDIPVNAILTSASVHDSQVAMPLMVSTSAVLTYLYDVADAAYCSPILNDASRKLGHVPLVDHNPRRGEKIPFAPHEAQRYKVRSQSERVNAYLKDSHGGSDVWVRGHCKIMLHLMFGLMVIAAQQILRLLQ